MAKLGFNYLPYGLMVALVLIVAAVCLITGQQQNAQGALVIDAGQEKVLGCIDSDKENDPWKFGDVRVGTIKYEDSCFEKPLKQYKCGKDSRAVLVRDFRCAQGCEKGACKRNI